MGSVAINPPKTPVTEGSSGIAAATLPNICKMPGPPAPFVPTPLPNIGKSGDSPKGYSKSVTISGKAVAITGASFGSQGDMASKGTGGGLVSSNTHGPTKFIGPGSMNVQIEGKNVQLLGDPMLNNCGPGGSPANAATMTGVVQGANVVAVTYGDDKLCGKCQKEMHPLEAGPESLEMIRRLFKQMRKSFDAQKAEIRELNQTSVLLKAKRRERLKLFEKRSVGLTPAEQQQLAALPAEISSLEAQVDSLMTTFFNANALLRWDDDYGTYCKGYMFGVMVCACLGEKLAACSGKAPPDLLRAVSSAGFTCVSPPVPPKVVNGASQGKAAGGPVQKNAPPDPKAGWECAAKQIMENASHGPKQLIERWFSPLVKGLKHVTKDRSFTASSPTIVFEALVEHPQTKILTVEKAYTKNNFKTGDNVPSCAKCQQWLPEMYCQKRCS